MKYDVVERDEFFVIGVESRTTNENRRGMKDVGDLWGKFIAQDISNDIPNKINNDIYCFYLDYESDYSGAYTTIIGCKVTSLDNIPEGCVGRRIPACKYNCYGVSGKLPESLINTWEYLWATSKDIDRVYTMDFELYKEETLIPDFYINPENAKVEIYISVK